MKIYNIGSLNIDYVYQVEHFVRAGETLSSANMQIFPGGKGLNQSIALARAGVKPIHGAVCGINGEFLLQTMQESGVDVSRITKKEYPSGHAIIQVDKSGQNCILLFAGTNGLIDRDYIGKFLMNAKPGDILLMQNEVSCPKVIMEIAHSKGMQIALNPSPYEDNIKELPLEYVTWWFCNEIEGEALFGGKDVEIADHFLKQYPDSNLILTLGEKGSIFVNNKMRICQPIYKTNVVDTTAAGDTFTGYFIAEVVKGQSIETAMKIASKASSLTVSKQGASESIPYRGIVEKKLDALVD